jgi:AcrR family transcriptional regulator
VSRAADPEAQRRQLLAGSLPVFAERGYGAVTMRGLAKELGVSTGALYHYFEGKESLFRQMFEQVSRADVAEATALLDAEAPLTEQLSALRGYVLARQAHLERVLLVALDFHRQQPEARGFLAGTVGFYRQALMDRLGPAGDALGPVLLSALMGALVHGVLDPESVDLGAQLDLLQGLGGALG